VTLRPDNRLADAPMRPVECHTCGARVLVRKSSWEQTSVQWGAASLARCDHHRDAAGRTGGRVDVRDETFWLCPRLRESIEAAVREGTLPVLGEMPANHDRSPNAPRR
jgi:hypothetical protein